MSIEHSTVYYVALFIYIIILVIALFKKEWNFKGYIVFSLTFITCIHVIIYTLVPFEVYLPIINLRALEQYIPFYYTLKYLNLTDISLFTITWYFIQHILYTIAVGIGTQILLNGRLIKKVIFPIILTVLIILRAYLNYFIYFDTGILLCIWGGFFSGIWIGSTLQKHLQINIRHKDENII